MAPPEAEGEDVSRDPGHWRHTYTVARTLPVPDRQLGSSQEGVGGFYRPSWPFGRVSTVHEAEQNFWHVSGTRLSPHAIVRSQDRVLERFKSSLGHLQMVALTSNWSEPPLFSRLARSIPAWYHGSMAMTLRLTPDDEEALALLAEADGVSKQEATVRAIHEAASRRLRQDKVRTLSSEGRQRYADLLDRLGQ